METRQHTSRALHRDVPIGDIIDRLDAVERQLDDALRLAQAGCLACQQALAAVSVLRSRISAGVLDTHALQNVDRQHNGHGEPLWLVDVSVPVDEPSGPLTPREIEVLVLIADGHSNKEIALRLCLSIRTVERHINNIYRKIEAQNKADATAWALRHNLA